MLKKLQIQNKGVIMNSIEAIELGATHVVKIAHSKTYYKKVKAFNMNLLEYLDGTTWKMQFGYLPWDELEDITA